MASPDKTKKSQVFKRSANGLVHYPMLYTNPARATRITHVRTSVARSESMPSKPILAKIAVSAANTADNNAQ